MAHNFRVKIVPHKNKDGTLSKSRKDHVVIDRTRSGSRVVGVATSAKHAQELIVEERSRLVAEHILSHPNDLKFFDKLMKGI